MLKIENPTGLLLTLPSDKIEQVVLELCGGGNTEQSVRNAMLSLHSLRETGQITINGYNLSLIGDEK